MRQVEERAGGVNHKRHELMTKREARPELPTNRLGQYKQALSGRGSEIHSSLSYQLEQ